MKKKFYINILMVEQMLVRTVLFIIMMAYPEGNFVKAKKSLKVNG